METLNVNVSAEDVFSQNESLNAPKEQVFSAKNYLQARLEDGESTKTIKIRLLPFSPDGGSPFHKIYMHTVKVNKSVSTNGWKSFVCANHNKELQLEDTRCPYCETAAKAKQLMFAATNDIDKKNYSNVEYAHRAKEKWVVRCIERGHEDDGVKFWVFTHTQKDGIYNKIYDLFKLRYEESGDLKYNIFDVNDGKDIVLTLTKTNDGKTSITIADAGFSSPLSKDANQAKAWIADSKKWSDVYKTKTYDYLSILLEGGVPKFDEDQKTYVNLADLKKDEDKTSSTQEDSPKEETKISTPKSETDETLDQIVSGNNVQIEGVDDDLPF